MTDLHNKLANKKVINNMSRIEKNSVTDWAASISNA